MRTEIEKKTEQYFDSELKRKRPHELHKYASDNVLLRGHEVREFFILMLSLTALLVTFDFANKCAC